jgi:hypothetical protein
VRSTLQRAALTPERLDDRAVDAWVNFNLESVMGTERRIILGAGTAVLLIAGCAGAGQNLKPAQAANEVAGMDSAAKATDNRVEVIAQTKEWPGSARITEEVEAVRVRITNNSTEPVQIRYGNIRLVANDGDTYSAIPPLEVQGDVTARQTRVVETPLFVHSRYMVAPYYLNTYPGLVLYDGPFAYDAGYYGLYDQYWTTANLPTAEMIGWALPEGVLSPGGFVDGYVYFERVPSEKEQVRLEAVLTAQPAQAQQAAQAQDTTPQGRGATEQTQAAAARAQGANDRATAGTSGEQFASVSIPFVVE